MNDKQLRGDLVELKYVAETYPEDFSNLNAFDHARIKMAVEVIEFLMQENYQLKLKVKLNELEKSKKNS